MKKIYQYIILLIIFALSIITGVFQNFSLDPQLPGEINSSNNFLWILFLILIFSIPAIAILHKMVKKYQEHQKYFQKQEGLLSK